MSTLTLIYARSHTVGGFLIRLFQWAAPWNHVAVFVPGVEKDRVLNAVWHWQSWKPRGVVAEDFDEWKKRYSEIEFVDVEVPDTGAGILRGFELVGAKYDWRGLVQMISSRFGIRSKPGTYHCVSFVEGEVMRAARRMRVRVDPARVTVVQSRMVY